MSGGILGWLRGLLAVGLLAGFYALAFLLVAVDVVFVGLVLWATFAEPTLASNWTVVVAGSIPAVSALVYGVAAVSRAEQPPPGAVVVRRREAPGLWWLVEELAGQLGTRPPARIYLTPEANAAVSEESRLLGFAVGTRTLYLGAPLLTRLPPAQLRAVLCHEFGHYAGRHTRFGAVTYRGAVSLESTLFRLRMTAQAGRGITSYARLFHVVLGGYARVYLRLSLAVRRRQELEADARAAAVAGPAVTAEALRAVHALGHAWTGFLETFVRPVRRLGFVPEDLFGAFATMMDDPFVEERLAELRAHPVEADRSPRDSHPPLARRLALIEARSSVTPAIGDGDGPLLADRAPLRRVQQKIFARARARARAGAGARSRPAAVDWATWADVAAEACAAEPAGLLLDAARGAAVTARPTLGTVLDLLEGGLRDELIRRLPDAPDPGQQLAEALYALVGQALADADRARWVFSWTKGCLLVPAEETGRELEDLVAAAAGDPSAVPELRRDLAERGLDGDAAVPLDRRAAAARARAGLAADGTGRAGAGPVAPRSGPVAPRSGRGGSTAGVRITGQLPGFVVEEIERQRTVRNFTLAVLLVLGAAWGIAVAQPDEPDGLPPASATVRENTTLGENWTLPYPWDDAPTPATTPRSPLVRPSYALPPLPLPSLVRPSYALPPLPLPSLGLSVTSVVVDRGDTLSGIACRYHTTVRELQELNDLGTRTRIDVGQTLRVPTGPGSGIVAIGCD